MEVVRPPKARSGTDIFQSGGFGELRIGEEGNQDEYIDIDDDDNDAGPQIESGMANNAPVAGVSRGATGVRTGAKSMAGSTLAPQEVAGVSSTSSHGRREQHTAGSQGSVGRSSRSVVVVGSLPQPTVRADGSHEDSYGSVPEVFKEETSKRSVPNRLQTQMSIKSKVIQRQPIVGLSKSLSKSVDKNDEDRLGSRERDAQIISKRKALDMEPSVTTRTKRTKVHGDPNYSSGMPRKSNRAEEAQPRGTSLSTRKEDSPSKRKERSDAKEGEGKEKTLGASGISREKRSRKLVLGDETDDDMHDEPQSAAMQESTDLRKRDVSTLVGENGVAPFRSAFPLHAKKKVHPPVSGGNKSLAGTEYATQSSHTWIACSNCKIPQRANADGHLKKSIWCCGRVTLDPRYASCSAPQELNCRPKVEEVYDDELEVIPRIPTRTEGQATLNETKDKDKDVDAEDEVRRNMVWVKLQVDGKELYWPGLQVTEFPPAIQKRMEDFIEEFKMQPKVVFLFNPRKDLNEFQVVKRSLLKPFHQTRLSHKNSSSHPDFLVAVARADEYYAQPYTLTGINEEDAGCRVEDMPHEEAESNEVESAKTPDREVDQVPVEVDDAKTPDVEVNQVLVAVEDAETPEGEANRVSAVVEDANAETPDGEANQVLAEVEDANAETPDGEANQVLAEVEDAIAERPDGEANQVSAVVEDANAETPDGEANQVLAEGEDANAETPDGEANQVLAEVEDAIAERPDGEANQVSAEVEDANAERPDGEANQVLAEVEDANAERPDGEPVEVEEGVDDLSPDAGDGSGLSDKRDDVQFAQFQADELKEVPEIEIPAKKGKDDVEASERPNISDASGLEVSYVSGEKLVLDLEILPTKRLISYDDTTDMLLFQDGTAVSIDTEFLGKELNKSSTGRDLHACLREVGREAVRRPFPKNARSSNGLKFGALDPLDSFAQRLRDTWVREYKNEPMPELLMSRFVAGCLLEERGEPVNWASEPNRVIKKELKEIYDKSRESLSPYVTKLITQLIEKQVGQALLPALKAVKEEEPMNSTEYDPYCQQCNNSGGELLCCDGSGCSKTYHLKCLTPPLQEPPLGTFFCSGCSAEVSKPSVVEVGSSFGMEHCFNLHTNDVSRQEPHGVAQSITLVGDVDSLKRNASVNSRTNLEVDTMTTEAAGELLSSKNDGRFCISNADTSVQVGTDSGGITLVTNNSTKDAAHQLPSSNAHGTENTALKDTNVVEDLCVSRMVVDATVVEESQIRSMPSLVDPSQTKHLKEHCMQAALGNASSSIGFSTGTASPLDLRSNGLKESGGESCKQSNVQAVGSSPCIPLTDNGAIQLVNRDERSGNRVESSLLCGFTRSGPPEQRRNDSASDLEEGEISPSEQANALNRTVNNSMSKLTSSSAPLVTQDISPGVELPREEDEFPSSDDHNSICEGCEVGGELMYVTTPSLSSTPSSPLLLCDGKGCKIVYHKECLNPPLQTVPAGEWYCPKCEKRKVEKIWSVRKACSVVRGGSDTKRSNATSSGNIQADQYDSEDEAQDDISLKAQFGSSSQRPDGEVAVNEPGKESGSCANTLSTNPKDDTLEYLVQWKSRAHAHDKWVSEEELEKIAPKELARFKKLLQEGQEKYDSEWAEPERVIQKRLTRVTRRQPDSAVDKENISSIQNAEVEWFVKWKGLGYECCTWEPADVGVLATPRGIELINIYEMWTDAAKQRASKERQEEADERVRLSIMDLDTQPEWMVRPELLPLQLEALNKLRRLWHGRMNGILVYEASQEKIVMTIMFFLSLVEDFRVVRPILVVVPKSLIQNWEHELDQWAPKLYIVNYASKTEDARGIIRRTEFSSFIGPFKPQIVLTTFEVVNCDMDYLKRVEWEALIIDEGRRQRLQKSYQKSYRPFSQIRSTFRLLLLSEPLKSNVEELIQFVNFLEPRKSVFPHGDEMTQVAELRRRLTGRVLEYIPENRLIEYWVPVEMTPVHLNQYYDLLVRHYPTLSRNHRDHQIQEVVTKLRQSCNHPFLADPALESSRKKDPNTALLDHDIEISGKMRLLHLMMPILKAANWRVLIFSQETKQLNILERYMTQSHGYDSYERVDSDLATKAKEAAIQRFNAEGSNRFVLLLKTGVRISFKNVQFLLLYDSDWNPANDMRALHKIHNEGEASSKPLPVLRLYTHLSVEESTLVLFRDKQLPPTRANINAKICQKLLTWGASNIFDRYDNSISPTGSSHRPKGAKVCPKTKLKQVVYDSEVVQKLLEALLCQEEGSKFEGDELLEAILVPRDEPASLFAESDHPINMIMGDSAEAFWASSLKWRHDAWQAKEVNMLGKRQRGKKRMTYDEDAMATAVYNKAQVSEESERRPPRRRKANSEEEQEVVTDPSAQVSIPQCLSSLSNDLHPDSTNTQVHTALPSNIPDTQQDAIVLPQLEVLGPAHGPMNHDHAYNRNAASEVVREPPKSNMELFLKCLSTVCTTLELPRPVAERVDGLLKHCQKFFRKVRLKHEIIAIELAVVWVAAKQLNFSVDKMTSMRKVEKEFGLPFDKPSQLVDLYDKLLELCANFQPLPPPLVVVSTTSQSLLEPLITSSETSLQDHPPRADLEPSRNVSVQATEGEEPGVLPENPLVGLQETLQPVEAEAPSPSSAQVTIPTDNAPAVEESDTVYTVDEPVVETDTEVVLVGADPRLVPEESLDTFIDQSRFNVSELRRISGDSDALKQGKGFILGGPLLDVLEEQFTFQDVATPAGGSSSTARFGGDHSYHGGSLQRGREAVSATLGAPLPEVPVIPTLESTVESTSSPLMRTQVPRNPNIEPARQNEQAAPDTPARLKERNHQDITLVIRGQLKESALRKLQTSQKLEELKRKYDANCRQHISDSSLVKEIQASYNEQKKILERLNQADFSALDVRQRADRDRLRDLYSKVILHATNATNGVGASLDVRKIALEIQRIRNYYSKYTEPTLTTSPLQGSSLHQVSALRTTPPTQRSPSTAEASSTSTMQANGGSRASQPLASASPAEDQQRQHVGRSSPRAIPIAASSPRQRGHSVQSSQQQRGHSVHSVTGEGLSNSQQPPTEVVSTAPMQHAGVQPRGHIQRSNTPVHAGPAPNLQRAAAAVSRSSSTPAMVPVVPSGVGHVPRPSAPITTMPLAGNATGPVYQDALLKEKEKLNKDLEKAKVAYESESHRIKAEYDKEAEILHKKYETLLVEQHRAFTKRQQQVQQNISKVEMNRQLADALRGREDLAVRAALFAGLSSQSVVQPFANQQAPQQTPVRPVSGGTAAASVPVNIPRATTGGTAAPPVHANVSRVTTNIGNAGPGFSGVNIQHSGTSSTRVSTAPVQQSSRFGMPSAPQQEPPRYGMPVVSRNEQLRTSMSEAMAVLAASGNAGILGNNTSAGISRAQVEIVFTVPPGPTNLDAVAGSAGPQTSGSSLPGVVAPIPLPPFQDPILSIIRNSIPSLDPVVTPPENPVVLPPVSPRGTSTSMSVPAAGMGSLLDLQSSGPATSLPAGIEGHILPRSQIVSEICSNNVIEGVPVRMTTSPISSGPQEQLVATIPASTRPPSLIYLSDSDDD